MNLPPTAHVEKRPTPNIAEQEMAMINDPHRLSREVYLSNPDRAPGSMPPQEHLNKLSKTGRLLAKATVLMERVNKQCTTFGRYGTNGVCINTLAHDAAYMQC